MGRKIKMNLLEKAAVGAGVVGAVSTLPYLDSGESALNNPYILGLLAIATLGACSRLYRTKNNNYDE
tara:strand:- start:2152 stop:2352 length:201 start_codon:yes stop_codon:yes gene_type:complete